MGKFVERAGDLGMVNEGWAGLTPSSFWFCCSHSAKGQDEAGPAAEAGVGVKSEPPESGCLYTTERI